MRRGEDALAGSSARLDILQMLQPLVRKVLIPFEAALETHRPAAKTMRCWTVTVNLVDSSQLSGDDLAGDRDSTM